MLNQNKSLRMSNVGKPKNTGPAWNSQNINRWKMWGGGHTVPLEWMMKKRKRMRMKRGKTERQSERKRICKEKVEWGRDAWRDKVSHNLSNSCSKAKSKPSIQSGRTRGRNGRLSTELSRIWIHWLEGELSCLFYWWLPNEAWALLLQTPDISDLRYVISTRTMTVEVNGFWFLKWTAQKSDNLQVTR